MRCALAILLLCAVWTPVQADECTSDLVAALSLENLEEHVEQLAFVRATPATQAQASAYIRAQLESYGYEVEVDPIQTSENLIVRRPGSATTVQRFVVGAHLDTVPGSPGADDNATCASLELGVGTVTCNASCQLDTSGCAQPPPDVQGVERIDKQD